MNKTQEARLTKLGKHLLNGGVHLPEWDFSTYITDSPNWKELKEKSVKLIEGLFGKIPSISPKNLCGTAGCAIGECTIVFPRSFKLGIRADILDIYVKSKNESGTHVLWKLIGAWSTRAVVADFFGLDYDKERDNEYETLFSFNINTDTREVQFESDNIKVYVLPNTATMQEVGNNILNYIKFRKHEQATK